MGWSWKQDYSDVILVPTAILMIFGYHIYYLCRCVKVPHTTVLGYEKHNMRAWIKRMVQVEANKRGPAISVISSNISAATSMSSISLALSSLIGTWIETSSKGNLTNVFVHGNTSQAIISTKYITLFACFFVAFMSFVETTRNYLRANFLISMPNNDIPVYCVEKAIIRGSNFWFVGMRTLTFATILLLWVFGPIPMFVVSMITVALLHKLDTNAIPLHQYQPLASDFTSDVGCREILVRNGIGPSNFLETSAE